MAWPVRSHRLYLGAPNLPASGLTDLAVVPTGKVFLLKDFTVANRASGTRNYNLYIKNGSTYYQFEAIGALAVGAAIGNPHHHLVMNAGEYIAIEGSAAGVVHLTFSGALLG